MKKEKERKHFIEQPHYPGGDKALTEFIYKNLRYPKLAAEAKLEGMVFLEYDIDFQGNVVETRVIQSLGLGCDEEAARVVRMLKFGVGKYRGLKVVFHKKAKIQFRMAKQPAVQPVVPPPPQIQLQYNFVPVSPAENLPENPSSNSGGATFSYSISVG